MADPEPVREEVRLSIILPIYNTGGCLEELYTRLRDTLEKMSLEFELLMIDDGSPDGASKKLEELAGKDVRIKALFLSRNFGQHPAISAGLEHANGNMLVLMDADLQDRPEDIPLLLAHLRPNVDIVYTVKTDAAEGFLTRLTSRLYHHVFSSITRTSVPRNIGTLRLFRRNVLDSLLTFPERHILYGPLMFFLGYRYVTVPVSHPPRGAGRSGYTFFSRLSLALSSILSYTDIPHRILMAGGMIISGVTFLYILALFIQYFLTDQPVPPGLTLLALLITLTLGTTMFALGIIGTYIFRVYQEVLARPRYLLLKTMNVEQRRAAGKHAAAQEADHAIGHYSS